MKPFYFQFKNPNYFLLWKIWLLLHDFSLIDKVIFLLFAKKKAFFLLCKILTIIHSLFISLSQLMVHAFFVGATKFNAHVCSPIKSASWTFQLITKFAILNRLTGNCSFGFIWWHGLICHYSPSTIKDEVCRYVKITIVILHIVTIYHPYLCILKLIGFNL